MPLIQGSVVIATNSLHGVALFLVQQGADCHIPGALGISPIQLRSTDVATLLLTFGRDKE